MKLINTSHVEIYTNEVKNRTAFKIKTGYKLETLSLETTKLLRSTKTNIDQDKDDENLPKLWSVEVVLVHCNLVNNNYQQASKVLFTFVLNKQLGQLNATASHSLRMSNTTNKEFSSIQVWFTDQNSKPFENEDNVNMTLIVG